MGIFVPEALTIFSSTGETLYALVDWRKKSKACYLGAIMLKA